MKHANRHKDMLIRVAEALGPKLCKEMAFVGGCTTGLLLTDDFTLEQVRHTDDVDLIVHLIGYPSYIQLQEQLREKGFRDRMDNNDPICAMSLGELRVDFMPDDEAVLTFTNRWYKAALQSADDYALTNDINIKLVKPVFFVATKLEAYLGRGNNDPLSSRDIEDLLNLFDGRPELLAEIEQADLDLRHYIATEIGNLLADNNFEYSVQSCAQNDRDRETLIFERLEHVAQETY